MSENDEQPILQALFELKSDTGALLEGQANAAKLFERHLIDDKALTDRVAEIERIQNQKKGARKVLSALAHGATGMVGVVAGTMFKRYIGH